MNKQLSRGFRNIKIVFKEALNCKERLLIQILDRAALENLFQKGFAKGCRQLVNKSCNTEVVIRNDCFFGIEYLADLKRRLGLFKRFSKIFKVIYGGSYADNGMNLKLSRKCVGNGRRQIFNILTVNIGLGFFNKGNVGFVYVDDKILCFFGE